VLGSIFFPIDFDQRSANNGNIGSTYGFNERTCQTT